MEYQRILHEVLKAELQKAMWIYEIYLLLVAGIYGPKKDFSSSSANFHLFWACLWTKII